MPESFTPPGGCCDPCEDTPVTNIPGPTGSTGAAGSSGSDGVNSYTTTTAAFTMPAAAATVVVAVEDTSWMAVGQWLYIATAGYLSVSSITDALTVVLENEDAAGNAVATTVIALGQKVSPGGVEGSTSLTGAASGDLTGTYPGPTLAIPAATGGLITSNGVTRQDFAVGADGTGLRADSAQPNGLIWEQTSLAAADSHVTGVLPVANGGTGQIAIPAAFDALSPATSQGDIIVDDGTNNVALGIGAAGQVLKVNSAGTDPEWGAATAATNMVQAYNKQSSGVAGATLLAAGWQSIELTAMPIDTGSIATFESVTSYSILLPAGTYRYRYEFVIEVILASGAGQTAGRLYNVNTAGPIADSYGIARKFDTSSPAVGDAVTVQREGRFTIAGSNEVLIQAYQVLGSRARLGNPTGITGVDEVHAVLTIEQES